MDADTREPLAGEPVGPLLASWVRGRREVRTAFKSVITDKDGTFSLPGLRPGDYVLDINSYAAAAKPVVPKAGYPAIVWPGGSGFESSVPFNVGYGATLNIGDIKLERRDLPSLTVAVTGGQCVAGQTYPVLLEQFSFSSFIVRGVLKASCGETAVFDHVTPGEYEISAEASWQEEQKRELGSVFVHIGKHNKNATVHV